MKKMNGDLMYKRMEKYANKVIAGSFVEDWKYETVEMEKQSSIYGAVRVVKLVQTITTVNDITFDLTSIVFVPFDARKPVVLDKIVD